MRGFVYNRCGCTDEHGRRLGAGCSELDHPGHGDWCYLADLPTIDGKSRQRRRGGFATQRKAQAALTELLLGLWAGPPVRDGPLTVGAFFDSWMDDNRHLRETTRRSYSAHVDHYLRPHLGAIPLTSLRAAHITDMYSSINAGNADRRRPVGPTSFARLHATLRAALNTAVKQHRIPINPALYVNLPTTRPPTVKPWSADELKLFLDAARSHRFGVLFQVMALTGLRRGAACDLCWKDVDLENGSLTVHRRPVNVGSRPQSGPPDIDRGERQRMDLDSATMAALLWYRLEQDDERAEWGTKYEDQGLVFCQENGSPVQPDYVTGLLHRIAVQAGLPRRRVHDLRAGSGSLPTAHSMATTEGATRQLHLTPNIPKLTDPAAARIPRHPRQSHGRDAH